MRRIDDRELALLYARALLAIARADHTIDADEGALLADRIAARCSPPIRLVDLLLEPPLSPEGFVQSMASGPGPFRGHAVSLRDVAIALVEDGVAIVLGKGHVSEIQADRLWRFASALGLTAEEFRQLTVTVAPWFPTETT